MGHFFERLAGALVEQGARVTKVNFNGGDEYYFGRPEAVPYGGTAEDWPARVRALMVEHGVTQLVLFGDRRTYHCSAIQEARALGVPVFVFEEGYLRPNFVTLEREGVNARSLIPRDPDCYRAYANTAILKAPPIGHTFWPAAFIAAAYAWQTEFARERFPHYRHHRDIQPVREGLRWILVGGPHKMLWKVRDRNALAKFAGPLSNKYFLVPLQVHNDFQVRGSVINSVEDFIQRVARTFATCAAPDEHLVFKHHPLDRAYRDYTQLLDDLREQLGLADRIHYIADPHLPTLLRHARGTIVLNSTVGFSSLQHETPTIALGESFYSIAGLSYRGTLEDFLRSPGTVDQEAVKGFSAYLATHTQLTGSFYKTPCLPDAHAAAARILGSDRGAD